MHKRPPDGSPVSQAPRGAGGGVRGQVALAWNSVRHARRWTLQPMRGKNKGWGPLGWSPGSVLPSCVSLGKLLALSELDTGGSKSSCRWTTGMESETHSQDPLTGRTPKPPSPPVHSVSGERVPGKRLLSPPPRPVCLLRPHTTAPPTRQEKGAIVLLSVWFPRGLPVPESTPW